MASTLLIGAGGWVATHRIADRAAPGIERDFLAAIEYAQARAVLGDIEQGLAVRSEAMVMASLHLETLRDTLVPPVTAQLTRVFKQSGLASESSFPLHLDLRFNLTNPAAVRYAQDSAAQLVRYVTEDARALVHDVIARGFLDGRTYHQMAQEIRQLVGLTPQLEVAVRRLRMELALPTRARLLVGRGMARVEIARELGLIGSNGQPSERMLTNLLAKPVMPLDEIERRVNRYAEKLLRFRAETIAVTEPMRASGAGRLELWRQAADNGFIDPVRSRRKWITTPDDRTCRYPLGGCRAVPNMNPHGVRLDEPFRTPWGPVLFAGGEHPRGRCAEILEAVALSRSLRLAA